MGNNFVGQHHVIEPVLLFNELTKKYGIIEDSQYYEPRNYRCGRNDAIYGRDNIEAALILMDESYVKSDNFTREIINGVVKIVYIC